jgi:transcription initiation factor TFIIIB Brf1 subunit/transcription initiation factor TFIIB
VRSIRELRISEDMLNELDKLPPAGDRKLVKWTPEMDQILLAYWEKKRQVAVAKIIGVCENTARKRYRMLTEFKEEVLDDKNMGSN